MPALSGLRIGVSRVHGYGMFATRRFGQAEVVVVAGDGVVYEEKDEFDDEYALVLPGPDAGKRNTGRVVYYDLVDQTRWINHSCAPNSEVDCRWDRETGIVTPWWVAIRDIEAGQEISYDYAFCGHLAVPCSCGGGGQCRGLIVDPDELDEVPAQYRHLIAPWLKRPIRVP